MIDQQNLITVDRFNGDAYRSSQAAELALNGAILRAEIGRSYEEFLEIFDRFYADDVEVSSEESRETIRGKASVLSLLLNFLAPLHVMVEVAGLSVSVQQTVVPRDTANETHSAWRLDIAGVGGKRTSIFGCLAESLGDYLRGNRTDSDSLLSANLSLRRTE
jgi:hypothetical protein